MRYHCYLCGKSVTSELPDDSVIRACLICPECIESRRVTFREINLGEGWRRVDRLVPEGTTSKPELTKTVGDE